MTEYLAGASFGCGALCFVFPEAAGAFVLGSVAILAAAIVCDIVSQFRS